MKEGFENADLFPPFKIKGYSPYFRNDSGGFDTINILHHC